MSKRFKHEVSPLGYLNYKEGRKIIDKIMCIHDGDKVLGEVIFFCEIVHSLMISPETHTLYNNV